MESEHSFKIISPADTSKIDDYKQNLHSKVGSVVLLKMIKIIKKMDILCEVSRNV